MFPETERESAESQWGRDSRDLRANPARWLLSDDFEGSFDYLETASNGAGWIGYAVSNVSAERFVRSIKDECLNRMIFFGESSLRKATRAFAAHYHRERNHQGLDNWLVEPDDRAESAFDPIECVQRLGGMLRFYHRAAA